MEVTDVNQLMSLIESGTVSIICDPSELQGSSDCIDDSVLASEASSNTTNILNHSLSESLVVREDNGKDKSDTITSICSAEDDRETNEFKSLHTEKEEKLEYQSVKSPQLHLPTEQYFFQTSDGEIIQVLGSFEQDADGSALPEVSLVKGVMDTSVPEHVESNNDGVQILVVGSNNTEDLYLISTPDKDTESSELQNSLTLGVKDDILVEDPEAACMLQSGSSVTSAHPPSTGQEGPLVKNEELNYEDDLLQNSLSIEDSKFESRQESYKGLDKFSSVPEELQLCNKDMLDNIMFLKHHHQKTPQDKQIFPLKTVPFKPLVEGSTMTTDRGDMAAYNLSSLAKVKESNGQTSRIQDVASMFGPAIKVLKPVQTKKEITPKAVSKKFPVFSCSDCSAVLHSERSLQNHQRKYHKDWEEECFICGRKFLNIQYVRSHIQEIHSGQESFQCRLCSYKCEFLKDLIRHHKSHKESRACNYCGRKYITLKLYMKHMMCCRERRKTQASRHNLDLVSATNDMPEREQNHLEALQGNQDGSSLKVKQTNEEYDGAELADVNMNDSSDRSHARRKLAKTSTDQRLPKTDDEFKFESKHYNKQAKKIAQEQVNLPVQRSSRAGRERTHRCYLCFKLFPTAKALETHKENYHLAKSERPVRVKTDAALDEWEEPADSIAHDLSTHCETYEEVTVKEEPIELSKDFDNITIIVDESVNTRVLKPLCIACKTHTNTDFRKHSKWFSQIPDDFQSDALKKFQQFFPCTFDPATLAEPWVLCKKCAILIDKIVDMEEKLSTMKSTLLLRVKESSESNSVVNQNGLASGSDTREDNQMEPLCSLMEGNIKNLKRNLSDIEAYMKDTCEIMEITKPQKRPGRPKKHMKEKLIPILVDGKYEEENMKGIVDFVTHSSVENENKNVQIDLDTDINKEETKSEEEKLLLKTRFQSYTTLHNEKVKQEPMEHELDSDRSNSESVSWDTVSMNNQNTHFHDAGIESEKRDQFDSHEFLPEMMLRNFQADKAESQNGLHDPKSQNHCETFSLENITVPSNRETQNSEVLDDNRCGTPETLDSREPIERDNALQSSLEDFDYESHESSTGNGEQAERLSTTLIFSKDNKTDIQKSDVPVKKVERKRARLKEERSKMCYKVDEASPKPWRCKECFKSFSTERGACDHYAASHKGENYACEHCAISYVRKRDLIGHYNKVHLNIKPYKCKLTECTETFSSHGQLYRHMQSAHTLKKASTRHECHMCGVSFSEKRYRDAHLLVCLSKGSSSMPYKCLFCHKAFKLAKYLQLHVRTVHWKGEQFFCEICKKILTDKKNLIIHMKSHLGQTKVKCNVCGKEFNRKSYLWTHMRTHTDHRPYKCNYCSKAFSQYSTWKNHERTHTGEKPYKCHICTANFATSSSLSKHIQYSHYNIRAFECELCKKKFISKAKIDEHMKVHTGEKPFKCHVCHRAFNKKNNLRTHMYVHSANKKYKCELCGEGFMRKSTIETHILERHKLEMIMNSDTVTGEIDVAATTSQFISMKGADDVPPEDSYIVVCTDEDEELSESKEMQVTVLAEDDISNKIGITATEVSTTSDCNASVTAVDPSSDVLTEVILKDSSGRGSSALTTLISNDIASAITIPEGSDETVSHVMEIDEASFKLVSEDATVSVYS